MLSQNQLLLQVSDEVHLVGAQSRQSSTPMSLFTITDPAEEEAQVQVQGQVEVQVQVQGLTVTHTAVNLAAVTLKAPD